MWKGAVGSRMNADTKTVKLNPHITKNSGVKRGGFSLDIRDQRV